MITRGAIPIHCSSDGDESAASTKSTHPIDRTRHWNHGMRSMLADRDLRALSIILNPRISNRWNGRWCLSVKIAGSYLRSLNRGYRVTDSK